MTHIGHRITVCMGKDCPICAKVEAARAARRTSRPERTDGVGSGYVRGQFIPHPGKGDLYDRGFWTHVTTSHGREVR